MTKVQSAVWQPIEDYYFHDLAESDQVRWMLGLNPIFPPDPLVEFIGEMTECVIEAAAAGMGFDVSTIHEAYELSLLGLTLCATYLTYLIAPPVIVAVGTLLAGLTVTIVTSSCYQSVKHFRQRKEQANQNLLLRDLLVHADEVTTLFLRAFKEATNCHPAPFDVREKHFMVDRQYDRHPMTFPDGYIHPSVDQADKQTMRHLKSHPIAFGRYLDHNNSNMETGEARQTNLSFMNKPAFAMRIKRRDTPESSKQTVIIKLCPATRLSFQITRCHDEADLISDRPDGYFIADGTLELIHAQEFAHDGPPYRTNTVYGLYRYDEANLLERGWVQHIFRILKGEDPEWVIDEDTSIGVPFPDDDEVVHEILPE